MTIKTSRVKESRIGKVDFDHLSFGTTFSDHMFRMNYAHGAWQEPEIVPFGPIQVMPSLSTLHYGQTVFEGLKAFRNRKGGVNIFRLDMHAERMKHSCERVCIPTVDNETFIQAVEALVDLDRDWVPKAKGTALYIRRWCCQRVVHRGQISRSSLLHNELAGGGYFKEGLNPSADESGDSGRACPEDLARPRPRQLRARSFRRPRQAEGNSSYLA